MSIRDEKILIFDGAYGSNLQQMDLPESAWGDYQGCPEYLNLSTPGAVQSLHEQFLDAGANVIETNTFGASSLVLAEYGLENRVAELNIAAVEIARKAIGDKPGKYIAGSIGPTTKIPSLGHVEIDEMAESYKEQVAALADAGVDILIVETCQDLMQAKIAVIAVFEVLNAKKLDIPVMLSVTMEATGTMLVGTNIASVVTTFEPFPLFSLGINCATGPEQMTSHVKYLSQNWPNRISIIPNAGMPEVRDNKAYFPLSPEDFANHIQQFVAKDGVSIVGGCCGTTPDHIRSLAQAVSTVEPAQRTVAFTPSLSSLYNSVTAAQEIAPLMIGERMNTHGSKKFKKLLLAENFEAAAKMGQTQEAKGAHLLDVCVAFAGRNEIEDATKLITLLNKSSKAPLVIDATRPEVIEAALKATPGRSLINSINLEDGGKTARKILPLAKKYGAAVMALTIGPDGMAMTTDKKVELTKELHALAVDEFGLRPSDLFIDTLTFTVGSGDTNLETAAIQTIEAIRRIKKEIPEVYTSLGLSNISFGLPPKSRKFLNSVFLKECIGAGLDAAIVDAAKIVSLSTIDESEKELCLNLIYDKKDKAKESPLTDYINHFKKRIAKGGEDRDTNAQNIPEEIMEKKLMDGDKEGLDDILDILLTKHAPLDIINKILVPAMRKVGELFGKGDMLLPFVLQSAEVMKASVGYLEPHMESKSDDENTKVLLATVAGDVHDIGKNLVNIILSNNGYKIYDLGTNIPTETIIQKAKEFNVDVVGLSGLLVKSAMEMQASIPLFQKDGINVPILLGGAALTRKFVANDCVPSHNAPVVYCPDAFSGLTAVQQSEKGNLSATTFADDAEINVQTTQQKSAVTQTDIATPQVPFDGRKIVTNIAPNDLFPLINERSLIRGRWGFKKKDATSDEFNAMLQDKAYPILESLKKHCVDENLIQPKVSYGYFDCYSKENELFVTTDEKTHVFSFPRQKHAPHLCIADYFKTKDNGGDKVGFFVGTVGSKIIEEAQKLYEANAYHDYLMLHGFAVEMADALAECIHLQMAHEMALDTRITDATHSVSGCPCCSSKKLKHNQGTRYGFGYAACPDLNAQKLVFELLNPSEIGVTLSEKMQMIPEATTSAIVVHHPEATYFSI